MSEVINLRTRRKQAGRDAKRAEGAASAAKHGVSKLQRGLDSARADKARRDLDGHRMDRDEPPRDPTG